MPWAYTHSDEVLRRLLALVRPARERVLQVILDKQNSLIDGGCFIAAFDDAGSTGESVGPDLIYPIRGDGRVPAFIRGASEAFNWIAYNRSLLRTLDRVPNSQRMTEGEAIRLTGFNLAFVGLTAEGNEAVCVLDFAWSWGIDAELLKKLKELNPTLARIPDEEFVERDELWPMIAKL